jgi:Ca-activated chloride channel family protein
MSYQIRRKFIVILGLVILSSCGSSDLRANGIEVKFLVGSALKDFCDQAAEKLNRQNPKLENGKPYYLKCEAKGSGDVVSDVVSLATQLKQGSLPADAPDFPTLISVDGEIYQAQLQSQVAALFPGQNYIPGVADAALLTSSPMVFMVPSDLARGVRQQSDLYKSLLTAKTHKDLAPDNQSLPLYFVMGAPIRSNSGLQSLVAQFAAVSGKRPEDLTVSDVQKYQPKVREIQSKITRYGVSTGQIANDMAKNGPFWASIASVYESSVIEANAGRGGTGTRFEAIYPKATFTSNMRAILPNAPWVSTDEKAAAEKTIEFLRSTEVQKIATELGLRPGVPGLELGTKFSAEYGVDPNARYDSLRSPKPEVVEAMLQSWREYAKKPSLVVIVVDSSGSMLGDKLPSVQSTLNSYINSLGEKEKVALIDFDSAIRPPVLVDGTPAGKERGLQFVSGLQAGGGTALYDATLYARNWLEQNLRPDAINAIVVLTDGEDSGSKHPLDFLAQELAKSGFASDKRVAVFTIGYGNEGEFNPEVLKTIADKNGGYYRKGDPETISTVMGDLQLEF